MSGGGPPRLRLRENTVYPDGKDQVLFDNAEFLVVRHGQYPDEGRCHRVAAYRVAGAHHLLEIGSVYTGPLVEHAAIATADWLGWAEDKNARTHASIASQIERAEGALAHLRDMLRVTL